MAQRKTGVRKLVVPRRPRADYFVGAPLSFRCQGLLIDALAGRGVTGTSESSPRVRKVQRGSESHAWLAFERGEATVPKFLVKVNYVGEGVKGLLAEGGTKRRQETERIAESLGGRLEAYYFAFGDTDCYIIGDFPDAASAAAAALTASASGRVTTTSTLLMTPGEVDEVVKKQVAYRPPGT
jgi:uncharacterized protein with GYD domain